MLDRDSLIRLIRDEAMIDSDTDPEYIRGVAGLAAALVPIHPSEDDMGDTIDSITRAITPTNK